MGFDKSVYEVLVESGSSADNTYAQSYKMYQRPNATMSGVWHFDDTTNASSVTVGSVVLAGGLSVAQDVFIGGLINQTKTATAGTPGFNAIRTTALGFNGTTTGLTGMYGRAKTAATTTFGTGAVFTGGLFWADLSSAFVVGSGNVIAGVRSIVELTDEDLSTTLSMPGGGESAIYYGQTWAGTGRIMHGMKLAAGAGTFIKNGMCFHGTGTWGRLIDVEWNSDDAMIIIEGGPEDVTATQHWKFAVGDATDHAGIVAEIGASSYGSIYSSTAGSLWCNMAGLWTVQA